MKNHKAIVILLVFISLGCKEEFNIDSIKFDNLLVIEGLITNEPGPYEIKLSTSAQVDNPAIYPKTNCEITIFDDQGYSEELTEIEPGLYSTNKNGIQGEIGKRYKISILTSEKKEYETEYQEILPPLGIDSIYEQIEYQESANAPYGAPGYQLFVNTKLSEDQEKCVLWTMVETYEYNADYRLYQLINDDGVHAPNFDTLYTCWKTDLVAKIYTAETSNLISNQINNKRLHFVGTDTRKLSVRYSLLLNQYTINQKSYSFWNDIEKQLTDNNVLFIEQPYNIKGNVRNVNDPDETVLGEFTVASVDKKRIFVDRPYVPFNYNLCYVIINEDYWSTTKDKYGIIYLAMTDDGWVGSVHKECLECQSHGGELTKPDFWID